MLSIAQQYVESAALRKLLPRATSGKTPVYFLGQLVLKHSGSPQNQDRLDRMEQARKLCNQGGYQNLIVPIGQIYQDFIVESRLPIVAHGTVAQIALYIEHRIQFTEAIK